MSARELHPDPAALVQGLLQSISEIASNIARARIALQTCDDGDAAALISDSLAVSGWLADRCLKEAGRTMSHGNADEWFLPPAVSDSFAQANGAAP